jgi:hypothetical protein
VTVLTRRDKNNNKRHLLLGTGAHTCNPSYSKVRDQENCDSKPAEANNSQDPISKIPNTHKKD